LVNEISLYYDARSKRHQISNCKNSAEKSKFKYEGKVKVILLKTESNNTDCAYVLSYSVLDCSDGFGLCISTQTKTQKFLYSAGGDESMHL